MGSNRYLPFSILLPAFRQPVWLMGINHIMAEVEIKTRPGICQGVLVHCCVAYAFTGPFSGTKNRLALATVFGSSVQKLFFDTFCHTRFGR